MDRAFQEAFSDGADALVSPFKDPIGCDAVIQWPGGVNMQLYWHTSAPSYATLKTIPENRVYVSPEKVAEFRRSFLAFSHGKVISDDAHVARTALCRRERRQRRRAMSEGQGIKKLRKCGYADASKLFVEPDLVVGFPDRHALY